MGSFLNKNCPDAIYDINLKDKANTKVAIDTTLFIYKFKYSKGENFILNFIEMINKLKSNSIEPIFVFDGEPPKEKGNTIEDRKEKKKEYKENLKALEEQKLNTQNEDDVKIITEQINKLNKKIIYVTDDNINQLKYLLETLNISYIHKDCEADIISSKLSSKGLVDMVISEDMDHLTSGTKYLIRDFNIKNNIAKCYDLEKIKELLKIDHDEFINLCILFGCDYLKRIKGLGTVSSFNIIRNNKNINVEKIIEIVKNTKNLEIPDNYLENFNKSRLLFLNNNVEVDESMVKKNEQFDNQKKNIYDYLKKYTNLSERKIINRINNIM